MSFVTARRYVRETVVGALGGRARPAHEYTAKCVRVSSTRIVCGVQFWNGPNDYYGSATVYYVHSTLSDDGVGWRDTYALHWVNDECYYHSGHRNQCPVHTKRGTW